MTELGIFAGGFISVRSPLVRTAAVGPDVQHSADWTAASPESAGSDPIQEPAA